MYFHLGNSLFNLQMKPIMSWTNPKPQRVHFVGVATGFGSTGEWIVHG